MQIQFFHAILIIQCKAYETGLEYLVSSVIWATFAILLGNLFWLGKLTNQVYMDSLAPTRWDA